VCTIAPGEVGNKLERTSRNGDEATHETYEPHKSRFRVRISFRFWRTLLNLKVLARGPRVEMTLRK